MDLEIREGKKASDDNRHTSTNPLGIFITQQSPEEKDKLDPPIQEQASQQFHEVIQYKGK